MTRAGETEDGISEATIALELELCDLIRVETAFQVAEQIRSARGEDNIRSTARSIGIGVATLSPLASARGGLPSEQTARKIDAAIGTDIASSVLQARERCTALREAHGSRRKATASRIGDARRRARLRTAVEAVTADAGLAEIVLGMTELPQHARRTIEKVVSDLTEAFLATDPSSALRPARMPEAPVEPVP